MDESEVVGERRRIADEVRLRYSSNLDGWKKIHETFTEKELSNRPIVFLDRLLFGLIPNGFLPIPLFYHEETHNQKPVKRVVEYRYQNYDMVVDLTNGRLLSGERGNVEWLYHHRPSINDPSEYLRDEIQKCVLTNQHLELLFASDKHVARFFPDYRSGLPEYYFDLLSCKDLDST